LVCDHAPPGRVRQRSWLVRVRYHRRVPDGDGMGEGHTTSSAISDRKLAARLMAGDPEALAEAYRHFAGLVFGLCCRVLNDQALAEDVAKEVFVFLWQCPDRFDPSLGSMRSWLALLAHRRSVDCLRATRRANSETECDISASLATETDDFLATSWLSGRVRDALGKLPAEQRQAVELAYYGGHTYHEVAVELAIPESTAKSFLQLAMKKLDELLRSDYNDEDAPAWT
jgi:RNA polymerase sigma factor (sigma-70 family)